MDSDEEKRRSPRGRRKSGQKQEQQLRGSSRRRNGRYEDDRDEDEKELDDLEVEEYWFVCNRWFAKSEDDGQIIRELLPTTEDGQPLDTGLQGLIVPSTCC